MKASLAGLALCSALLLAPGAARADAPIVIGPITDEGTVPIFECPGFQVLDRYVSNFVARRMLDREGNRIRLVEQVWGVDTFVNADTGKEIPAPYHNNTIVDFTTGLAAINGVVFKAIVPGVGPVFMDIGRVIVDRPGNLYFSAGPHQFFDADFEALCAALE
jgi:hypothetical protein